MRVIPKKTSHMVFSYLLPSPPSTVLAFTDYGDFCVLFRGSEFSVSQKYTARTGRMIQYQRQGRRLQISYSTLPFKR